MFKAEVCTIAIHSLGAILEEEHLAQMTIDKWNKENAEEQGKLFLQVQANCAIVPDVKVIIIDSYIDASKVDKIITTGKTTVLLFSTYHDPKNSTQTELDAIKAYREKINGTVICHDYDNKADFAKILISALEDAVK